MSHYQERIKSLIGQMNRCGFGITNPSEEPLGTKSTKKSVTFRADVLYKDGTPLKLSANYTNLVRAPSTIDLIFHKAGFDYQTGLDPDISSVTLSRGLPDGDYTILPDNEEQASLIRFIQMEEVKRTGLQRVLDKFGQGKTIRWNEATVLEFGQYGAYGMKLMYDFFIASTRRCNFGLDITSKTKEAQANGDLPHHTLQPEENHFCIVSDEYPLFPFSLEQAGVYEVCFDRISKLGRERFAQLFGGIPLPLGFQVSYQLSGFFYGGNGELSVECFGESLQSIALKLKGNMGLLGKFYQGFRSYALDYPTSTT